MHQIHVLKFTHKKTSFPQKYEVVFQNLSVLFSGM